MGCLRGGTRRPKKMIQANGKSPYIYIYIYLPGGDTPHPGNWIWIDSVLKLILYGTRFRINQSYPGNSGSYDPYISPILEIVDRTIHISVLSWKYWIVRSNISRMGLINSKSCSI